MRRAIWLCLLGIFLIPSWVFAQQQWSQGYWTPWGNPGIPATAIEWGGLTHVVHAWALVRPNGTLDLDTQLISTQGPVLVANAHAHGVKAILGIGQPYWLGQTTNFQTAITTNRNFLVNNIMNVVNTYGFDGVDIDWEPFNPSANGSAMQAFAADLRTRLGSTKTLSAAAIVSDYTFWGSIHTYFDRIGIMTYDLTGTWNPYSWHNAALYDTDGMVWSVDLAVKRFNNYGVPKSKLSIGIPFFGYRWQGGGITGPKQNWQGSPSVTQTYYQSLASSITPSSYRWDFSASVPYLSIDLPGTSADQFVTYDNEQSIADKVRYAENNGLGGWIIWELFGGYFPAQTPNQPLLVAIKNARTGGTPTDTTPPSVTINQAAGQADPASTLPLNFTVVFSEPVTGFTSSDITVGGTALGTKTVTVTGAGATYNVAIGGVTSSGTVVAMIPAGKAADGAGNLNTASTSSDNIITYSPPSTTRPAVTINQSVGQGDPTQVTPIWFSIVFSKPVTGFAADDVVVTGTAPGSKTPFMVGSGAIYHVAIVGITGSGTVIATIPANVAADASGNLNMASTSTDNSVTVGGSAQPPIAGWSVGYWTPFGSPAIAPADIEWAGLTHAVHAWALTGPDGSLDLETQRVSSDGPVLLAEAHARGVKVLLGVSQPYWLGQTTNLKDAAENNRAALVDNIMSVVDGYGFDGVQLDWRPFDAAADGGALSQLAADLRWRLGDRALSTSAVVTDHDYWATVQDSFDRIGVLTYDLTGTWNPYSWHNSALYDADGQTWSVHLAVDRYINAGVAPPKVMIGIPFSGYRWTGGRVTGPQQSWDTEPTLEAVPYHAIAPSITAENYQQDLNARVPYLTVDSLADESDSFVTFDDAWSVQEKASYAIARGIGGWMISDLSSDYLPTQTPSQPLLSAIAAVRNALADPTGPVASDQEDPAQ